MSDFENAGYRILSFKYTPINKIKGNEEKDDEKAHSLRSPRSPRSPPSPAAEGELPSLAPLMTALPDVEHTESTQYPTQHQDDNKMEPGPEPEPEPETGPEPGPDKDNSDTPSQHAQFHPFGDLPPELRLKIWHLTFLPRVIELHPTRPNYSAAHDDPGRQPLWQSGNSNPAALSVCTESRDLALEHFRIAFPLAEITTDQESPPPFSRYFGDTSTYNFSGPSTNGKARLLRRVVHLSPVHDTVT